MVADEQTPPPLDAQLCFALHDAARAMVGCYRPLLDEAGLTYTQYLVMLVLWESDEPVAVGTLCERLHMDSGTLSPLLKRLAARGLVTRSRSPHDERSVEIACTPAGHALRGPAARANAGFFAATGMTLEEATALRDQVVALTSRLRGNGHAQAG
ncbi:DNA-binding transcriptional regulator, MarR family [Pseudonocardia thermophila]|uniref:DNA-binding transcriptional regulator, MarR family n=1 Tax=Pseudonocardia thermophila TaxID=1848 RepID=A0A1M6WWJ6_PSETH|nr:MarR family transcriptional regulator [Pseudonocardia thermophila]SHK98093.1 DNA-binding transcriptional regulator, MarR family [Pseudonocardia thermophila]